MKLLRSYKKETPKESRFYIRSDSAVTWLSVFHIKKRSIYKDIQHAVVYSLFGRNSVHVNDHEKSV